MCHIDIYFGRTDHALVEFLFFVCFTNSLSWSLHLLEEIQVYSTLQILDTINGVPKERSSIWESTHKNYKYVIFSLV